MKIGKCRAQVEGWVSFSIPSCSGHANPSSPSLWCLLRRLTISGLLKLHLLHSISRTRQLTLIHIFASFSDESISWSPSAMVALS